MAYRVLLATLGFAAMSACSGDIGSDQSAPDGSSSAPYVLGLPTVAASGPAIAVSSPTAAGLPGQATVAGPADVAAPSTSGLPAAPATPETAAPDLGPRPGLAARISKLEYAHGILDVLGVTLSEDELAVIPADAGDGVFKHFADKQTSVEQHALGYFEVAELVSERVDMAGIIAGQTACASGDAPACGGAVIASLGRRLFRRSLDTREQETFQRLFEAGLAESLDTAGALRWTLVAMLQSPQYLFHIEDEISGTAGAARPVSAHELAARLASFLWVSVPDDALLEAADSGALLEAGALEQQVARMLQDAKAQRFTAAFIADFSRANLASFEGVTDELRLALNESVTATFQHHFWTAGRSVADLFTTTEFMLNPAVAELVGAQVASGVELVDVSALPERIGILTHPGAIAGMGDRNIGSFVGRGKYLMERLLCRNPIIFPQELLPDIEDFVTDTAGLSEHERMEIRKTRAECWVCHAQFEPLAFGFSRFDGAGRYLGESDAQGRPLPLDGWVPTTNEEESPRYANVAEYMQILATDPLAQTCMTEHFLAYATARHTDERAKEVAKVVGAEYQTNGSTLSAMVSAVSHTALFQQIEVVSADAVAAGEAAP